MKRLRPILRKVSRSFYLSLAVLPKKLRDSLSLAYALARASDSIADSSSAPAAERLRALEEWPLKVPAGLDVESPAERELLAILPHLLEQLAASPDREEISQVWRRIREGQIFDLRRFPSPTPLSAEELDHYAYLVAGCVGEFWTDLCTKHGWISADKTTSLRAQGRVFGQALQRVNILRDVQADMAQGRIYVPRESWNAEIQNARAGVQCGISYARSMTSLRLRIAVGLPALLANRTLDLVEASPGKRVKVPRREVWTAIFRCLRL